MNHASLSIVIVLGSLPVLFSLGAPKAAAPAAPLVVQDPNLGNCRPDIGPGGVLKVTAAPITTPGILEVMIMKSPLPNRAPVRVAAAAHVELKDWVLYTLKVDGTANPPKAELFDAAGASVLAGIPVIKTFSRTESVAGLFEPIVYTQNVGGNKTFDNAGLLHVIVKDPTPAATTVGIRYIATLSVFQTIWGEPLP